MGCQVHQMAEALLPGHLPKFKQERIASRNEAYQSVFDEYMIPESSMVHRLKVPTVIAYSGYDSVVDPYLIKKITESSKWIRPVQFGRDEKGKKIDHGYQVQQETSGRWVFETYEKYVNKRDYNNKVDRDDFVGLLEDHTNLKPSMQSFADYRYAVKIYASAFSEMQNLKNHLRVVDQTLRQSEEEILNSHSPEMFESLALGMNRIAYYESVCIYFNPKEAKTCQARKDYLALRDIRYSLLTDDQAMIWEEMRHRGSAPYREQRDDDILECVTFLCRNRGSVLTVKQVKEFLIQGTRKLAQVPGFTEWLHNFLAAPDNLKPPESIPPIIPLDQIGLIELVF
jgi:hypothetical protein